MRNLRHTLATSEEDRAFQSHLGDAEKALARAAQTCDRKVAALGGRHSPEGRKVDEARRQVGRILAQIQAIAHLDSRTTEDPDLLPEEVRIQQHRDKVDARRKAAQEQRAPRSS